MDNICTRQKGTSISGFELEKLSCILERDAKLFCYIEGLISINMN